jgi:hypothetical protein
MKKHIVLSTALSLFWLLANVDAQPGAPAAARGPAGGGPRFNGSMARLFGDNLAFTANLEVTTKGGGTNAPVTMPGKIAFLDGKTRFEINLDQIQGTKMQPTTSAQLKALGMDKVISITRPDKKLTLQVYPGMKAYIETPSQDSADDKASSDFKIETTEVGKETFDGHPCVRNKAVVTDPDGTKHEAFLWNATDVNNFPIKIQQNERDMGVTMLFKEVVLQKPDPSLFESPSGFTKYNDLSAMMRDKMMKQIGAERTAAKPQP